MYWATGGPLFNTLIAQGGGGQERRNQNWSIPLAKFNIANGIRTLDEAAATLEFWYMARGRLNGFRAKNWRDYAATVSVGRMGTGSVGDGYPTKQMYKRYGSGLFILDRPIFKPVASNPAPILYKNAIALTAGVDYTLATETGIATYASTNTKNIAAISNAANARVRTSVAHGYTNGQLVYMGPGILGMTQMNGLLATVTVVDADEFNTGINSSTFGTYTSGGTTNLYPQSGDALTWAGEFDELVRFDTDLSELGADPGGMLEWNSIMLVGLRAPNP